MKKVIRLTESNLVKIVQKIIKESQLITEAEASAKFTYTKIQNSGGKWLIEGRVTDYLDDKQTKIFSYYGATKQFEGRFTTIKGKKSYAPVFQGLGTLKLFGPNGKPENIFNGNFSNNVLNGKGTEKYIRSDGKTQAHSGNFVNGSLEGQGKIIWSDGSSVYGTFRRGAANGPVLLKNNKGLNVKANAINGNINGHLIMNELIDLSPDEYNKKVKTEGGIAQTLTMDHKDNKSKWYTYFGTDNKEDKAYAYQKRNGIWYSRLKSKWDDRVEIGLSDPKFKKSVDALNQAETDNRLKEFTK